MKVLDCPVNGPRNISEFQWFGAVRDAMPETPAEWKAHIFLLGNPAGVIREWWRHTPSNTFFIAERNTVTDEILRTYLPEAKDVR